MRIVGKAILLLSVVVVAVGLASGQQRFPGGGQGGAQDAASLLRNASVKKELKVTDEQLAKLPDAVLKALADVLDPDQLKRLKQIELQQRGPQAFKDPKIQTALKITDDQKENINNLVDDSTKAMRELVKDATGGNFQGMGEKMAALRKETAEKVQSTLTADQKKQWRDLVGDDFKLEVTGFGAGGTFKKKKKADDN